MKIVGIVENLIFQNSENFWTVLDLDCKGKLVTAVGYFPPVSEGEELTLEGEYGVNAKYGEQFVVSEVVGNLPESDEGISRYLSSGLFAGIGPVTAGNIVAKFGKETFTVMETNPAKLATVKGISRNKAEKICADFREKLGMKNTIMFFSKYGVTTSMASKIYRVYGVDSERIVSDNPYKLITDVDGIGFLTADKIATALGIPKDSEFRTAAAIIHIFKEVAARKGHTYLPFEDIEEQAFALLKEDGLSDRLVNALDGLILSNTVREVEGGFALDYYDNLERVAAAKLVKIKREFPERNIDVMADIAEYERINKISLHETQKKAVSEGVNSGVTVITGGPGTGKTTIIKCAIHILLNRGYTVGLCAPTGRAAKRMNEATGVEAKTIHRLLDLDFKDGKGHFTFNNETRLPFDMIIVDEVSMADVYVFNALIRAVANNAGIIIVGDKDQLPSVGAGNVLKDIIDCGLFPVCCLTQIYRQSGESLIITNAHRINGGEMPILDTNNKDFFFIERTSQEEMKETICGLVTERLPDYAGVSSAEIQVLAGVKRGVCGVNELNRALQQRINPASAEKKQIHVGDSILRVGDKVMQTVNNYSMSWKRAGDDGEMGSGVYNGDIGRIERITAEGIEVLFDDGRLAKYDAEDCLDLLLGYAVSVHKSQGSEFDVVVLAVLPGSSYIMTRNLLYTAVTRAKKLVVLVGEKKNIAFMVRNNFTAKRYTQLKRYLLSENEKYDALFN